MAYESNEIRTLRKAGKLREAYRLAKKLHQQNPHDKYIERELAWVLYGCLKRFKDPSSRFCGDSDAYLEVLKKIVDYSFDVKQNDLFYENLVKNVCSVGWELRKRKDTQGLQDLLSAVSSFGENSSAFKQDDTLRMFFAGLKGNASGMITLMNWYGLNFFDAQSFTKREFEGKKLLSFAEEVITCYLKILKDALPEEGNPIRKNFADAAQSVATFLQDPRCKTWEWPAYHLGKLLSELGDTSAARIYLTDVLLDKWNEPYAWGAFADTFKIEDPDSYATCLFKALTLSKKPTMRLHEKALLYFKDSKEYAAAKREALLILEHCRSEGYNPSAVVTAAEREAWYTTSPSPDNSDLYRQLSEGAEEKALASATKTNFYLEWCDPDGGRAGIVMLGAKQPGTSPIWASHYYRITIRNEELARSFPAGNVYCGVLSKNKKNFIGTIEACTDIAYKDCFIMRYRGIFEPIKSFGFIREFSREVFIPPSLLADGDLVPYSTVCGIAVAEFRDDCWRMRAQSIELVAKPNLEEFKKTFTGYLNISFRGYGFIDNCFVPKSLIVNNGLYDGDRLTVTAKKSWDRKKGCWGWSATELHRTD